MIKALLQTFKDWLNDKHLHKKVAAFEEKLQILNTTVNKKENEINEQFIDICLSYFSLKHVHHLNHASEMIKSFIGENSDLQDAFQALHKDKSDLRASAKQTNKWYLYLFLSVIMALTIMSAPIHGLFNSHITLIFLVVIAALTTLDLLRQIRNIHTKNINVTTMGQHAAQEDNSSPLIQAWESEKKTMLNEQEHRLQKMIYVELMISIIGMGFAIVGIIPSIEILAMVAFIIGILTVAIPIVLGVYEHHQHQKDVNDECHQHHLTAIEKICQPKTADRFADGNENGPLTKSTAQISDPMRKDPGKDSANIGPHEKRSRERQ